MNSGLRILNRANGRIGIKLTNQRVEILAFLKDNFTRPTAEKIFMEVKKKLTRIFKAPVYKNLKVLTQEGLIRGVNVKGISRFPKE